MQYRKDKKGNELSVLGYGCMRFTRKGGAIDIEKAESEVLRAIELGVNYFDTAYLYPGSEQALGQILYDTGMRDKIYIATKLPHYMLKSMNAIEKTFSAELSRLKTDHIDYYLMHMLTDFASWQRLLDMGIEQWILNKKASGAVRNIGFSFHGNTEEFKKILDSYDWDFCQIQYNYMDEYAQAGRKGLEYAASLGIPVIIMEPLRGGKLVSSLPEEAYDIMKSSPRDWSPAQWGFRWLWNQSAVTVVLSGMNSLQQVEESAQCAENALPGELTGA
jgi:predicted aldo/keto reductase-like oxidoreductase